MKLPVKKQDSDKNLSQSEQRQYKLHLLLDKIGKQGQLRLKQAKILIIGAGGLGCPNLQYLTAAGVGNIGIVDFDTVEQSNLQRQVLYTINDIGKPKATTVARRLKKINPYINITAYNEPLSSKNALHLFKQYDLVIDGSDNFATRYLINDAAVLAKKPWIYGAVFNFEGQLSVFNYKQGATYRCLYPQEPNYEEVPNCTELGVLGVLPGIIGSLQANEAIKIICKIGHVLTNKLLIYNVLTMKQNLLKLKRTKRAQLTRIKATDIFFCEEKNTSTAITLDELKINWRKYNLLDIREDWEREEQNNQGQHIPLAELTQRYTELPTDKPLVVYCNSGSRSEIAINLLKEKLSSVSFIKLKGKL
ncbi:MAG: molybdopterin-synthase adenylyltransferase MoeB [Tenacibaculum sp.]